MSKPSLIIALFACLPHIVPAQTADTLTLNETIQRVASTYPTVRQAEEAVKSAGYNVKMAQAALYQKELTEKQIRQQVSENYYSLVADYNQMEQLSRQVILAGKAYDQAKVNYEAGSITNLELLTSSTNLSGSRLQQLQAKINYQIGYYKLLVSIGTPIW